MNITGVTMNINISKFTFILILCFVINSCTTVSNIPIANEVTLASYKITGDSSAVVIVSVFWGRQWNCGAYHNVEIMSMGFDRYPLQQQTVNNHSDIYIDSPFQLFKKSNYYHYALLLKPGKYALSSYTIKVARTVSDLKRIHANRENLIKNTKSIGVTFEAKAGAVVYIGKFQVNCKNKPIIGYDYIKQEKEFTTLMAEIKQKYPFIDPNKIIVEPFELPTK